MINQKIREDILKIQNPSNEDIEMYSYVKKHLFDYKTIIEDGRNGFIIEVGTEDYKPLFCSHLDSVHSIVNNYTIYKEKTHDGDIIYHSPTGIGGDDKCGIIIMLSLIQAGVAGYYAFFRNEEIGCIGSNKLDISGIVGKVSLIMGFDRRSSSDIIIDSFENNSEVLNILENNFTDINITEGLISDCWTISRRLKNEIMCMNIFSGFYEPHSKSEYISLKGMKKAYKFTIDLLGMLTPYSKVYKNNISDVLICSACLCKDGTHNILGEYFCEGCIADALLKEGFV